MKVTHPCHDPFCPRFVERKERMKRRRVSDAERKRPKPKYRCTAAVQMGEHTIAGIHPWLQCGGAVGPNGDMEAMRCARHKKGAKGGHLPAFKDVRSNKWT